MRKNNSASNLVPRNDLDLNLIKNSVEVSSRESIWIRIKNFLCASFVADDLSLEKWVKLESKHYRNSSGRNHDCQLDHRNQIYWSNYGKNI